jgi:hypothetical protein
MSAIPLTPALEQTSPEVRLGPRLCEKSKTLDRDRTSYSFKAAIGAYTASPFNFEIEPENIILVTLRLFEFPHGLGQKETFGGANDLEAKYQLRGARRQSGAQSVGCGPS